MAFNYTFRSDDISSWDADTRDLVENRDRELELYSTTIDSSFLNLNADNLTSGTVPSSRVTGSYTGITQVGTLAAGVASYSIGDTGPSGGKVFITPSTPGNTTGLYFEVALVSAEVKRNWSQFSPINYRSTSVPLAQFNTIGSGKSNTVAIVNQGNSNPDVTAAKYCDDFTYGGFSDWFLASKDELAEIYTNRVVLGNDFAPSSYWSSSESSATEAWAQNFLFGNQAATNKSFAISIRPVRSFSTIGLDVRGLAVVRTAATQDGVSLTGRGGGTSDYVVSISPTTLTANQTVTLPNVSGTAITTGNLSSITEVGTLNNLTIVNTTAANKILVVQGAASQSGNYFEIQNSSGNTLTTLNSGGVLINGGNTSTSYGVGFGASASGFRASSIFQANNFSSFTAVAGGTLWQDNNGAALIAIGKSRGTTAGDMTIVQAGDSLGAIMIGGADGARILQAARINIIVDGTPALDVMPGAITFQTNAGGTTAAERMRISAAGLVGIGITAPTSKLHVVGSFSRGAPVTKTGSFTLADTENWIICNGTATITVTLPAASTQVGREISIKTIAAFTVVSASSNVVALTSLNITTTAILPATAGAWVTLVSNGTNWVTMRS